jgi:hypothetical protein
MGTHYLFKCSCGFRATVAGDFDVGDAGATATIVCKTCKKLFDVKVATVAVMPDDPIDWNPVGCPKNRNHPWRIWTYPGPCPRCGATVKLGEMLALWD